MQLIAIGRLRGGPEFDLFERYNMRLRPPLTIIELPEQRGSAPIIRRREAEALRGALPRGAFTVALDLGGTALTSEAFAECLANWSILARPICFLIGGAEGLDATLIQRADYILSLGLMTWPHFLVRALLAEQLYRAHAIAHGHPYHRASRPES